ncbi:hypothetical protein B0I00_2281 [Novosphingobium kunmingense]|uniref:Uncharacterized protein n=1 Tax=Novosphingobium kunmingense TaxID=1211806 RepID=A0A2N0H6W8_9SPHN|nr:hypothetical protein [Novosphingobium kunmingense]PKB14683.1 hypothetical protein B0I00_2281 [Novosphingobium kunmingense]
MSLTLAELFASPDHYLHSFADGAAVFVPMDRDAYRRSVFLDDRIDPAGNGAMRVPLGMLVGQAPAPRPIGWIFHVAHCGSTLLANALDALGPNLVLREPLALRQLGVAREVDDALMAVELAMLGKAYDADAPTLVKANVPVNFVLNAIAAARPDAPAIMLYLGLEDYLCAILRSANHRHWLRGVSAQLAHHLGPADGRSDAACAAALWQAQMTRFGAAMKAMPAARALDAEAFYADTFGTLLATALHFGMDVDTAAIAALIAGPVFQTYSKRPGVAFSNADRLERQAATRDSLAEEIEEAHQWLDGQGHDAEALARTLEESSLR